MNIEKLIQIVKINEIPEWHYSFGSYGNDQSTDIIFEDGRWVIYTNERGQRSDVKYFENESDACNELLNQIKFELQQMGKKIKI